MVPTAGGIQLDSSGVAATDGWIVRNYDLDFLKRFSMVLGFLALTTVGLILFASYLNGLIPPEVSPQAQAAEQARIAPEGAVYAGATGAASQAAAAAAATAAAASQVAYGGTLDGSTIYGNLCTGCHSTGAGNAPTLDKAHWAARLAQGTDVLHKHAIDGYTGPDGGVMPAKGGNPALTDEQVIATVDWMLSQL
jgi:cytochrome c5